MNNLHQQAIEVWQTLIGEQYGGMVQMVLSLLSDVPADVCTDAINKISRETSLGPLLNPTAYVGGERFDNANEYMEVLSALRTLLHVLNKVSKNNQKIERIT